MPRINKLKQMLVKTYDRADLAEIVDLAGPQSGPHVTNAGPGQSLHNYGYAVDAAPVVGGKIQWNSDHPAWQVYGQCARDVGLIWAGDWDTFKEFPHVQLAGVDWKELIVSTKPAPKEERVVHSEGFEPED